MYRKHYYFVVVLHVILQSTEIRNKFGINNIIQGVIEMTRSEKL